jgi:hypothetical protein
MFSEWISIAKIRCADEEGKQLILSLFHFPFLRVV